MSKFIKRLQKTIKKDISNCVVVGNNPQCASDIINGFDTVFCVNWQEVLPKFKNIIPIQDTGFLQDRSEIDLIFLNQRFDENILQFITPLSKRTSPTILLNNDTVLSPEYINFFSRIKYEMIQIVDQYQIWKKIRK
jgi:hypothetical protein